MYMPKLIRKDVKKLSIMVHVLMFIIGITFGSFYTLAVYRIPLKQDITHTHSYCPKCNHRLGFLDLIPVLSYICLGGKCRYCKDKIRPRYLVLELLSGTVFLLYSIFLNIDLLNIEAVKIVNLVFGVCFFSTVFITVGIFNEYKSVQKSVFNFGIIVEAIYIVYLYILNRSIYRYIIYVIALLFMVMVNNSKAKEKLKIIAFLLFILIGILEICLTI